MLKHIPATEIICSTLQYNNMETVIKYETQVKSIYMNTWKGHVCQ